MNHRLAENIRERSLFGLGIELFTRGESNRSVNQGFFQKNIFQKTCCIFSKDWDSAAHECHGECQQECWRTFMAKPVWVASESHSFSSLKKFIQGTLTYWIHFFGMMVVARWGCSIGWGGWLRFTWCFGSPRKCTAKWSCSTTVPDKHLGPVWCWELWGANMQ